MLKFFVCLGKKHDDFRIYEVREKCFELTWEAFFAAEK
jgi:hypothetical protein